jgi:hypothetical protein
MIKMTVSCQKTKQFQVLPGDFLKQQRGIISRVYEDTAPILFQKIAIGLQFPQAECLNSHRIVIISSHPATGLILLRAEKLVFQFAENR